MFKLNNLRRVTFKRTKYTFDKYPFLKQLGLSETNLGVYSNGKWLGSGESLISNNPVTNQPTATVTTATKSEYDDAVDATLKNNRTWQKIPAPKRGKTRKKILI